MTGFWTRESYSAFAARANGAANQAAGLALLERRLRVGEFVRLAHEQAAGRRALQHVADHHAVQQPLGHPLLEEAVVEVRLIGGEHEAALETIGDAALTTHERAPGL